MESKVSKSVKVVLVLNEKEAKWLRDLTQNFIGPGSIEEAEDRKIRQDFFKAVDIKGK